MMDYFFHISGIKDYGSVLVSPDMIQVLADAEIRQCSICTPRGKNLFKQRSLTIQFEKILQHVHRICNNVMHICLLFMRSRDLTPGAPDLTCCWELSLLHGLDFLANSSLSLGLHDTCLSDFRVFFSFLDNISKVQEPVGGGWGDARVYNDETLW